MAHVCSSARTYRETTDGTVRCVDCGEVAVKGVRKMKTAQKRRVCMWCGAPRPRGASSVNCGCTGAQEFRASEARREARAAVAHVSGREGAPVASDQGVYIRAKRAGKPHDEAMAAAREAAEQRASDEVAARLEGGLSVGPRTRTRRLAGSPPAPPSMAKYIRAKRAGKSKDEAMREARS